MTLLFKEVLRHLLKLCSEQLDPCSKLVGGKTRLEVLRDIRGALDGGLKKASFSSVSASRLSSKVSTEIVAFLLRGQS